MSRRSSAAVGVILTIALGIASRKVPIGVPLWDKSLGDALYTVMIYFIAALIRPRWSAVRLGFMAITISIAIEIVQLTDLTLRLPRLLRIALGTTFAWHDIACYLVGGAVVTIADHVIRDDARSPS